MNLERINILRDVGNLDDGCHLPLNLEVKVISV